MMELVPSGLDICKPKHLELITRSVLCHRSCRPQREVSQPRAREEDVPQQCVQPALPPRAARLSAAPQARPRRGQRNAPLPEPPFEHWHPAFEHSRRVLNQVAKV